jgi:glycosyltransferase involved in cell wall biosynthesis
LRRRTGVQHDVAIYSPFASEYYEATAPQGGGAELQMTFLARELAARGWHVAHIVFPIVDPIEIDQARLTIHTREPYHGAEPGLNRLREASAIWRALRAVNARTYLVRASALYVAAVAEFCRLHRRGMVFSTANDFDLARHSVNSSRLKHAIYRHGLRAADTVVVQSTHQLALAQEVLGNGQHLELIPSFAEQVRAQVRDPDTFLWVGRISDYKRPLDFVQLARALPEARFVMVAADAVDTDDELLERIRREAREFSNLELVGPLRREEVLAYLEHTVAIVSTSDWEGMPNVFLEAWARSVPALSLSFDPDGMIVERRLGLAAGGSWDRFTEAGASLWSDCELRASLGENAKRYIEERHDPAMVCDRWESALRRIGV